MIGAATLLLCACTPDYPKLPPLPAKAAPFSTADAAFLQQANEHDLTEAAMAKLADNHARSSDVKALGARSATDYEAHRKTLASLADKHGLALTDTLMAKDQERVDRLSGLHGRAFDRAYVEAMEREAKSVQPVITTTYTTTKDSDVKAAATAMQKLDQRSISSAYSWLPQLSTRKYGKSAR